MITVGLLVAGVSFAVGALTVAVASHLPIVPPSVGLAIMACITGVIGGLALALGAAVWQVL